MTDQTQTTTEPVGAVTDDDLKALREAIAIEYYAGSDRFGDAFKRIHQHLTTPQPLAIGLDRQGAIAAMSIELEKHPAFPDAVKALVWCSRLYDAALAAPAEGWRGIETWQPKSAAAHWPYLQALILVDGDVMQGDWKPGDKPPETGEWWPANLDSEYGDVVYPTHWMPLPAAPTGGRS